MSAQSARRPAEQRRAEPRGAFAGLHLQRPVLTLIFKFYILYSYTVPSLIFIQVRSILRGSRQLLNITPLTCCVDDASLSTLKMLNNSKYKCCTYSGVSVCSAR